MRVSEEITFEATFCRDPVRGSSLITGHTSMASHPSADSQCLFSD